MTMGNIGSRFFRPFKNWNVENRAHKVISKEKPTVAPSYPSMYKEKELVDKFDPEYKTKAGKKDSQLDDYLKQVYVESNSAEVKDIDSRSDPDRPLPKEKLMQARFEFGFYESSEIKEGRVSLRQALKFIEEHCKEPKKYTAEVISNNYKLDPTVTANILEYYKIFEVRQTEKNYLTEAVGYIPISNFSGAKIKHPIQPKKVEAKFDETKNKKVLRQIEDN